MSCPPKRIVYRNRPSYAAESQILEKELEKIFRVDTCMEFRFEVTFLSHGTGLLNNFSCKVYPWGGDDNGDLLGTLQRGDDPQMREIKRLYNGC